MSLRSIKQSYTAHSSSRIREVKQRAIVFVAFIGDEQEQYDIPCACIYVAVLLSENLRRAFFTFPSMLVFLTIFQRLMIRSILLGLLLALSVFRCELSGLLASWMS